MNDITIKTIKPILWMGPAVFKITASDERSVLVRLGNHGWYACSSVREVHDGGAKVAGATPTCSKHPEERLGAGGRSLRTART